MFFQGSFKNAVPLFCLIWTHPMISYWTLFADIIFIFVSYLGKKGHVAFQRIDRIYEIQDEAYMNQETEITIL